MLLQIMLQAAATGNNEKMIYGIVIAVITGIISSFISNFFQFRFERQKQKLEQEAKQKSDFKQEVAKLVRLLMLLLQEGTWTTWGIVKGGDEVNRALLDQYNASTKERLNQTVGHLAFIAAINRSVYDQLLMITKQVTKLEAELTERIVSAMQQDASNEAFQELLSKFLQMEDALPEQFAEILKQIDEQK